MQCFIISLRDMQSHMTPKRIPLMHYFLARDEILPTNLIYFINFYRKSAWIHFSTPPPPPYPPSPPFSSPLKKNANSREIRRNGDLIRLPRSTQFRSLLLEMQHFLRCIRFSPLTLLTSPCFMEASRGVTLEGHS